MAQAATSRTRRARGAAADMVAIGDGWLAAVAGGGVQGPPAGRRLQLRGARRRVTTSNAAQDEGRSDRKPRLGAWSFFEGHDHPPGRIACCDGP